MRVLVKRKAFGDKIVLENVDLTFEKGHCYGIMGPSGRGKTTLMRILLSLDKDYEGYLEDVPQSPIAVFQEDRLVPSLTVGANLRAVSGDGNRIDELLGRIGLFEELDHRVDSLSGGMKRRISIVRALLLDYDWLFLDEPFKGLDDDSRKKTANLILSESNDKGIIVITHDKEDILLLNGEVISL